MFESDDFDQVLSQFDFTEVIPVQSKEKENLSNEAPDYMISDSHTEKIKPPNISKEVDLVIVPSSNNITNILVDNELSNTSPTNNINNSLKTNEHKDINETPKLNTFISPKHTKRKIINSYFDHKCKRKFPGPAGLLSDVLEECKDESICQIELLSQDIDCTENLRKDLFDSPIWIRLLSDLRTWKQNDVDSIKAIKQQAHSGNLRRRKAQTVSGFVEAVDRSAIDPLLILRDTTGTIKCTLHRDAWSTFAPYIVSEYCALVLQKPTVLTTGAAFKKHYLNITLSNILAVYSSAVLSEEDNKILPNGYSFVIEEEFTVIKTETCANSSGTSEQQNNSGEELFDGLDSIFSDDVF